MLPLMFGCGAADSGAVAETGATFVAPEVPPPTWTASEVAEQIDATLAPGLPDPFAISALYVSLLDHAESFCPAVVDNSMSAPFEGCRTTGGWIFAGYSQWAEGSDPATLVIESDVTVVSPEGALFVGAGKNDFAQTDTGWTSKITGTWGMDGVDGWLGTVPGISLWAALDGELLTIYGGYSDTSTQVYFDTVTWSGAGPSGAVQLRDPSGYWYTLRFDESCGGCGTVDFEGTALGAAEVDLDTVFAGFVAAMDAR